MTSGESNNFGLNAPSCVHCFRNGNFGFICEAVDITKSRDMINYDVESGATLNSQPTSPTMSQTFDLHTTNLRGAVAGSPFQGTPFSDSPPSGDILSSIITKIGIRADRHVHSLQVLDGYFPWAMDFMS